MKVIIEDIAVFFLSYLPEDLKVWKWMIMITK